MRLWLFLIVLAGCDFAFRLQPDPNDAGSNDPGDGSNDGSNDGGLEDPCPATVACPSLGSPAAHSGLHEIDRCAFPLVGRTLAVDDIIDAYPLPHRTIEDVLGDLNRNGAPVPAVPGTVPAATRAYAWTAGDIDVPYWIPQGITGSFDANDTGLVNGKKIVIVSWYYDKESEVGSIAEKGIRLAIADVTDPGAIKYRLALLVEPTGTVTVPDFKSVPFHAGGLVWIDHLLYVPITNSGFRVFDLSRILEVDSDNNDLIGRDNAGVYHSHAYQYAVPQVATYALGACNPRFSFASLDRTTTPPTLVSGEYSDTTLTGRLYRWPLDGATLALTNQGRSIPMDAWVMSESHVQGAVGNHSQFWLSSSRPTGGHGELIRTAPEQGSATLGWSDGPEDVAYDPQDDAIWSVTEGVGARVLFEVPLSSLQ